MVRRESKRLARTIFVSWIRKFFRLGWLLDAIRAGYGLLLLRRLQLQTPDSVFERTTGTRIELILQRQRLCH